MPPAVRRVIRNPLLLVVAFAVVSGWCASRHELWLDEANPWVIARDASSLAGLWFNMRFEPHPPLWYLLLFVFTRFTTNPAAMQVLHVAIATGTVALIAWLAPFRIRDKWLLAFSYYFVFEYGVISRGYALGLLLAFLAVALIARRRATPIRTALLLAACANTSAFGLILSGALACGWLAGRQAQGIRFGRLAAAAGVYGSGVALSVYAMVPRPENMYGRGVHVVPSGDRLVHTFDLFWAAFFPLPDVGTSTPWNSNLFLAMWPASDPQAPHWILAGATTLLCLALLWALRRSLAAAVVFASGALAAFALLYVEYSGGYRHHGHYVILFVLAWWLAEAAAGGSSAAIRRGGGGLFTTLLLVQLVAGIYFLAEDARHPFSYSKQVAAFVRGLPRNTSLVVAQPQFLSFIGPPVSAYLRRPVYYAYSRGVVKGSYLVYDRAHRTGASEHDIYEDVAELSNQFGTDVYVIANHWKPTVFGEPITTFTDHLVPDEQNCGIYVFKARRGGRGGDISTGPGQPIGPP